MFLYHWHGVLQNMYAGDIVVYAPDLETARSLALYRVREHYEVLVYSQEEDGNVEDNERYQSDVETIEVVNPIRYDQPVALPFSGSD